MTENVLITLLAKDNEKYIHYLKKCIQLTENNKKNKNYIFNYLCLTNNNQDNTTKLLKEIPNMEVIDKDYENLFGSIGRIDKLSFLRQELLTLTRKKNFDYLIMLDTDVFFNGEHVNKILKELKNSDKKVIGVNTLSYPYPIFYDFAPLKKETIINIVSIFLKLIVPWEKTINLDSYFCGFMAFKKEVIDNKKINYSKKCQKCEHIEFFDKVVSEGYKIEIFNNITPIFEGMHSYYSKTKNLYPKIYNLVEKDKCDLRWNTPVFILFVLLCLLVLVYKKRSTIFNRV